MMVRLPGLDENFDPENFERAAPRLSDQLEEGVTVLAVTAAKKASDGTVRCWDCRRAADGSLDCVRVDCPPTFLMESSLQS
jgi:hypothetical protein